MTPYEPCFGVKHKVKHLRVFGCDACAHIPKDERGKFDSKAWRCILVGYSSESKGYRLYDPEQRKLIVSRDVKFNKEQKNIEISTFENETDKISTLQLNLIVKKSLQKQTLKMKHQRNNLNKNNQSEGPLG